MNIGRIVAGVANLAIIPFRDGINLNKMRKPLWRVIEPVLTIVVVLLAFTFVPGLSSAKSAKGNITERIRSGAEDLKKGVTGQVGEYVDVDKLGAKARKALKELEPSSGAAADPSKAGDGSQSGESTIGGLIKDVKVRAREVINETKKQP